MQQLIRIREKLDQLRNMDIRQELPGADAHQYRLNPVLKPEEVHRFETTHQVQLPEEYVAFLTNLGDGGAGPFQGLRQLEGSRISFFDPTGAHQYFDLSRPFPHTEKWNMEWELEALDARLEAAYEAGNQQLEKQLFERKWDLISGTEHDQGRLYMTDDGYGTQISLVVNGQEKGNMWSDERINDGGIHPSNELGNTGKISFLNWYELWLDHALKKMRGVQRRFFPFLSLNEPRKIRDSVSCK
ncbi:SMI1/KNR4 family protein [Niabella sp.]|uniref:SMI1/KNR4 family protein n=1 Tax=Niabella sp. TaxID=1962976 RepID=UPI00261FFEE3|nr:SMI1/KNR4 family protein [Niabella sp.]